MIKRDLLGFELWECDRDVLRNLWKTQPADRWRLCSHEEIDAHYRDGPDEITAWIDRKRDRPGEYLYPLCAQYVAEGKDGAMFAELAREMEGEE